MHPATLDVSGPVFEEPRLEDVAALLTKPSRSPEEYALHIVAHQWALATALAINSRSDFASLPKLNVEPYDHQISAAITYFRRLAPRGLIADDVGLGKTVTAGLILSELIKRRRVKSYLVVCPKLIMAQWQEELRGKFNLDPTPVSGGVIRSFLRKRELITTYATARAYMNELAEQKFDMVILDESHKLRKLHGVQAPAQVASRFFEAMRKRTFKYVLQLTATPLQTSLWDIYSLIDILKTPDVNPLGPMVDFEDKYLGMVPGTRRTNPRSLRNETREEFRRRLSEVMIRTRRRDTRLVFPDRKVNTVAVEVSAKEREFLQKTLELAMKDAHIFERISMMMGAMSSPAAGARQLRNKIEKHSIPAGMSSNEVQELIALGESIPSSGKLQKLVAILRKLAEERPSDWRAVVFTGRLETQEFIKKGLQQAGLGAAVGFIQGGRGSANQASIRAYKANPPEVHVIVSTDAGAEGVNLQDGNVLVNFDLPWNPMIIEQRIGRIQRLGQRAAHVVIFNLVAKDTVEERVVARLLERLKLFECAIGEMEEILSMAGHDKEEEDGPASFEHMLLRMVESALKNRDVEKELELQRKAIEEARSKMQELEKAQEECLGRIDDAGGGPMMPQLTPTRPDMSLKDFTIKALQGPKGTAIQAEDGITWKVTNPERGEYGLRVTFETDHPVFDMERLGASAVTLYAEGERAFEHLVHEWMDRGQAQLFALPNPTDEEVFLGFRRRFAGRDAWLSEVELSIAERRVEVLPRIEWKSNISVFHDQYEKILSTSSSRYSHGLNEWPAAAVPEPVQDFNQLRSSLLSLLPVVAQDVKVAVRADKDLQGFSTFYIARLSEETERLNRAKREDPRLTQQATEQVLESLKRRFLPQLRVQPIGLRALRYDVVVMEVSRMMGSRRASARIEYVPATDRLASPWLSSATQRELVDPVLCIGNHLVNQGETSGCGQEACQITVCKVCESRELSKCGTCQIFLCADHTCRCVVCKHPGCAAHCVMMEDQQRACLHCSGVCQESGARLPLTELAPCAVSRVQVRKSLLKASAISGAFALPRLMEPCQESGDLALPGELVQCEVTNKKVSPDLLGKCQVSNRRVLRKLLATCEATGHQVLPEHLRICEETRKSVREDLIEPCSITGKRVQRSLLEKSALSGHVGLRDQGCRSAVSGKWALPSEVLNCEVTGKPALPEELSFCSVSGKRVLPTLLKKCQSTGQCALPDHVGRSDISGREVLKSLLVPCEKTGRLALPDELKACAESGLRVVPQLLTTCEHTNTMVLPEHLGVSKVSGKRVRKSALRPSMVSGELALAQELESCAVTQKLALPSELETCGVSGMRALPGHFAVSQLTGATGLKIHECECLGCLKRLFKQELRPCSSCRLSYCQECVPSEPCLGCREVQSKSAPVMPATIIPAEFRQAVPKAAKWRYIKRGRLHVGLSQPGLFGLFSKPELVVVAEHDNGRREVVANHPVARA